MKKVVVDKNKCIGCGSCVALCPQAFVIGDDGKAKSKQKAGEQACLQEAVENCPVKAIKLTS